MYEVNQVFPPGFKNGNHQTTAENEQSEQVTIARLQAYFQPSFHQQGH